MTAEEGAFLIFPVGGGDILESESQVFTVRKHERTPIVSQEKIKFKECISSLETQTKIPVRKVKYEDKLNSEAEPEPESEAEAEPEVEPENEAEAEPEVEPESEAEAEAEPESEAEAEPEVEPEAEHL